MKIERFEDIEAWQLSRKLTNEIYVITGEGNFSHDFGLRITIKPLYSLTLISHAIMLMMNPGRYGANHRIIDAKMVELLSIS
jgi:hypothetical protein